MPKAGFARRYGTSSRSLPKPKRPAPARQPQEPAPAPPEPPQDDSTSYASNF